MEAHKELSAFLNICKEKVSPLLLSYLKSEFQSYQEIINEYPKRMGKYLRPSLFLLSLQLHGGKPDDWLKIAAAIQLSEEWLLIHDDAEDHAIERRSTPAEFKPALNQMVGYEIAINAGDTLHAIMWKVVGEAVRERENGWEIYEKMADIIIKTTEGQYQELDWIQNSKTDVMQNDYFQMVDKKTAYYSIIGPLQLGALAAGYDDKTISSIPSFGIALGRCFQLKDDIINLTVDHKITGKEQYGDIIEGKRTIIFIELLNRCTTSEKKRLNRIFCSKTRSKSTEEINYVLRSMRRYKTVEYAQKLADDYAREAEVNFIKYCNQLEKPDHASMKQMLNLIKFIQSRNR